jgi:regulator of extracellular matrix RemA (YlzA/DUF370 family)
MKKQILQSEVDAILTNEKIISRLEQEKNHLKRLIQENRILAYRISTIDREYCAWTGSVVHGASYSKGILTHQYLKGKRVFRVKVGALPSKGGFSKAYVVDIPLEILNQ